MPEEAAVDKVTGREVPWHDLPYFGGHLYTVDDYDLRGIQCGRTYRRST